MRIPISDDENQDISKYFEKSITFISNMLKRTSVLITCRKGISRSATICIAYIMYDKNLNFKKALNYVG